MNGSNEQEQGASAIADRAASLRPQPASQSSQSGIPSAFTPGELVFLKRMAFHVCNGLSMDDAARAVIADDERIFSAIHDKRSSFYMPTADDRGRAFTTGERKGDLIASELARTVYRKCREGLAA